MNIKKFVADYIAPLAITAAASALFFGGAWVGYEVGREAAQAEVCRTTANACEFGCRTDADVTCEKFRALLRGTH